MWRPRFREAYLSHLLTAAGVSLIAVVLASGPLGHAGKASQPAQQMVASAHMASAAQTPTRPVEYVSSRGSRSSGPAQSAQATSTTPTATPIPTPTLFPTPAPSPAPAPAQAPSRDRDLRVGIQAGHWKCSELPAELASLRTSTGAAGPGWKEVDVNLDVATRVQAILTEKGIQVDLIPSTVPVGYKADAFVALHGDANSNTAVSGYKLARATRSTIPAKDDALLAAISHEYTASTGLKNHPGSITVNMTSYYAFANRGIAHSVAPTTPSVILEMGFLTTPGDRKLLLEQPQNAAEGIAKGIMDYLGVN
ncbi:MAG TPA: N-acetylmuramoyl-L-alanine amidase [Chloroflexota bacterium]|nr:N-acetylmuramoyl-L-alanine amidase [Chloroflexota bacterium]